MEEKTVRTIISGLGLSTLILIAYNAGTVNEKQRASQEKINQAKTAYPRPAPDKVYGGSEVITMPKDCKELFDFRLNSRTENYEVQCNDENGDRAFYTSVKDNPYHSWVKVLAKMPDKQ